MFRRCVRFPVFARRWVTTTRAVISERYANEDIFEPYQEYTSPPPPPPLTSLSTLHNQLETLTPSTYSTTRALLDDLLSPAIGLPIPQSPLFLSAALMAFDPSLPLTSTERIRDFTLWFTYYPPLHPGPLADLRTHLQSTAEGNLPFYTTLSQQLARKGYISFANRHLLPSICRYSSSGFMEFYGEYESSIHAYFSTLKTQSGLQKTLSITRSIAMRFLAEAGHVDDAICLLSTEYTLHPKTQSIVLSRLLDSPPSPARDLHISKLRALAPVTRKWKPVPKRSNSLRDLSRSLLSADPRDFPPTNDLVDFLTLYMTSPRHTSSTNAITLLHTRTERLSPIPFRAISHVLFAHMVLLFRLRTSSPHLPALGPAALRALLDLFLRFFHVHGVSESTLVQYTTKEGSPHFYLSTLAALRTSLPKLFPSRLHISLVWQSLAHLAPSHPALIELYNELIHYATPQTTPSSPLQTPQSWTSRGHRLPSNTTAYPPLQWTSHAHPSPIIAECFTPFIIKLMHASATPTSILRTLLSLSLSPTIYHYTEMARWWAWHGHESKVWIILDRLEGARADHPTSVHNPLPPPDLPFYIALMRAFLSSPHYSSASPSPSPSPPIPSPHNPLLPPYPPTSPYPGTLRRLTALSHLWSHMELRFGRPYLLAQLGLTDAPTYTYSINPYLKKAVSNWRTLAGIPSP